MDTYPVIALTVFVVILAISGGMLAATIARHIGRLKAEIQDIHEREDQNETVMQSIIHSLSYRVGELEDESRKKNQEDQCRDRD